MIAAEVHTIMGARSSVLSRRKSVSTLRVRFSGDVPGVLKRLCDPALPGGSRSLCP